MPARNVLECLFLILFILCVAYVTLMSVQW